jgi:hypothetical protein
MDLGVEGVLESEEESEGGFAPLNADNDNGSAFVSDTSESIPTQRDFSVSPIPMEDDLKKVTVEIGSDALPGVFRIRVNSGESRIKLWDNLNKSNEIQLSNGYKEYSAANMPSEFYVEGVECSEALRDIELSLEYLPNGSVVASDVVKLSVTPVVKNFSIMTGSVQIVGEVFQCVAGAIFDSEVYSQGLAGELRFIQTVDNVSGGAEYTGASGRPMLYLKPLSSSVSFPLTDSGPEDYKHSIFYTIAGVNDGETAKLANIDNPSLEFASIPHQDNLLKIDVSFDFSMYLVWRFDDGSIYTLSKGLWDVRFEATNDEQGIGLGPNAGISSEATQNTNETPSKLGTPWPNSVNFGWNE